MSAIPEPDRRAAQVAEVLKNAPGSAIRTLERAFSGQASKRDAIKANCLCCTHYDRAEIRECRVYRCPLWAYRPYQPGAGEEAVEATP